MGLVMSHNPWQRPAFEETWLTWTNKLTRFFCRTRKLQEATALDLVQETLCKIWKRSGTFTGSSQVEWEQWVWTLAENVCKDYHRKLKRHAAVDGTALENVRDPTSQQQAIEVRSELQVIGDLTELEQECLRQHYLLGMTDREISASLGVTLHCIKNDGNGR